MDHAFPMFRHPAAFTGQIALFREMMAEMGSVGKLIELECHGCASRVTRMKVIECL